MKASPYIDIRRIEFVVTYQCSGHCAHCSMGDRLNRPGPRKCVEPDLAARAVRELASQFDVSSVMTFGGEPLLYPDSTVAIHSTATEAGIELRQIITNGYFTRREGKPRQVARQLAASGVNELMLSVDAFHQQSIPLEAVRTFAAEAKTVGLPVILHPAWLVAQSHQNPNNEKTRKILEALSDLDLPVSTGNDIFLSGHAAINLAEFYPAQSIDPASRCGSMPYTEPLTRISSISIVPSGDVMVCAFAIGNLYQDSILDILARYDPHHHPQMRAVLEGGAAGLIEYARAKRPDMKATQYSNMCGLCQALAGM